MNAQTPVSKTAFKLSPIEIGKRISARREEMKLSQKAVGKACGLSQNSVLKIERGQFEKSRFVPAIWDFLGLELTELSDIYASRKSEAELPKPDYAVRRTIKVLLIERISYEEVELPEAGSGAGIMISWTMRNGATISGVMDQSMIPASVREFAVVARRIGVDPAKYVQARD